VASIAHCHMQNPIVVLFIFADLVQDVEGHCHVNDGAAWSSKLKVLGRRHLNKRHC